MNTPCNYSFSKILGQLFILKIYQINKGIKRLLGWGGLASLASPDEPPLIACRSNSEGFKKNNKALQKCKKYRYS